MRAAELGRPAEGVALPERQPTGQPRRRARTSTWSWVMSTIRQERRAEREHVADPGLVDHLLVQLADPATGAPGPSSAGQEHPVQPAVRDGAAGGDRQPLRARPAGEQSGHPVPGQPGPQLGELLAGVAAGQHVQHRFQGAAAERGERRRPAQQLEQVVDGDRLHRADRDDLLGGDVQRVRDHRQRLDGARPASVRRPRPPRSGRRGTSGTSRRGSARRPGDRPGRSAAARWPPTAAPPPGSTRSTAPMSMPELQRRGGDHRRQQPGLELVLDQRPLLPGHRPVVGLGQDRRRAERGAGLGHHLGGRPGPLGLVAQLARRPAARRGSR